MNTTVPAVVGVPVAAATAVQVEPRPFLRDLARTTVIYVVTYATILGISLHHYM